MLAISMALNAPRANPIQRAINILKSAGPGAWYDPSDLTTLFQDSAGTTPVTAVEQPVGLILDKSQGLVLGAELLSPVWTVPSTGVTQSGNNLIFAAAPAGLTSQGNKTGANKSYALSITVDSISGGSIKMLVSGGAGTATITTPGTYTAIAKAGDIDGPYISVTSGTVTAVVSASSCREIPGNHLIQPTATSRPTLSSRYNLLTKTEAFDDAYWTGEAGGGGGSVPVRVANDAVAPDGTTTADKLTFSAATTADLSLLNGVVSGLVTGGSYVVKVFVKAATPGDVGKSIVYRSVGADSYSALTLTTDYQQISLTSVAAAPSTDGLSIGLRPVAGGSTGTVSVHIWGASLVPASDAALPYQRVNTATDYDYDFSKFPPFLRFDGVDDSMYSAASIDFTSTDKMTVFAGLHKAVSGVTVAVELSPNVDSSNNAFNLATDVIANSWYWSTGSNAQGQLRAFVTPAASPVTSVLSTVFDRSLLTNAQIAARINGAAATVNYYSAASTSNFGNYPLYIGIRSSANALHFNGRLYQLAIKGKALSAAEISTVESFINSRTKAFV